MVFLRDRARDIGTGYKTRIPVPDGVPDESAWTEGELACDCTRGRILYGGGAFACGTSRFVVEQIVDCEDGRVWRPAVPERARRVPEGHAPGDPGSP